MDDDSIISGGLVRRYTFELEDEIANRPADQPSEEHERALIEHRRRGDERREQVLSNLRSYFTSSEYSQFNELELRQKELSDALIAFQNTLPVEQRGSFGSRKCSMGDVIKVVEGVRQKWELQRDSGQFGKAKKYFHRFARTLDGHSNALKMLPRESEYVSLFCGSLETLVKASVNYSNLSEALSLCLIDINDAVSLVEKEVWLYKSPEVRQLAARLYTQIFTVLTGFLKWYTERSRTRFRWSFNQNIHEVFQKEIAEIQRLSKEVNRAANLGLSAEVRVTRMVAENVDENVQFLIDLQKHDVSDRQRREEERRRFMAEFMEEERKKMIKENKSNMMELMGQFWAGVRTDIIGSALNELLEQRAQKFLEEQGSRSNRSPARRSWGASSAAPQLNPVDEPQFRTEVQYNSKDLDDYFDSSQVMIRPASSSFFFTEESVAARLREWTSGESGPNIVNLAGPNDLREESSTSLVAAQLCCLLREAKFPVVSFFCSLSHEEPPEGRCRETVGLVALIYALIRQLTELIPVNFKEPEPQLGANRFEELDGTLRSWSQALAIFADLLDFADQPVLFIIIDGLQWLDDHTHRSTDKYLEEFISLLQDRANLESERNHRSLKVLFTTNGLSEALAATLDDDNLFVAENKSRPMGRPSPGRKPLVLQ